MNLNEIVSTHTKAFMSSIKNNHVLYSIGYGNDNEEELSDSLSKIKKLSEKLHDFLIENKEGVGEHNLRVYTKSPEAPDTEYFSFSPHLNIGYSPFIFYKNNGDILGQFIKIQHLRYVWCTKTIGRLAEKVYEQKFKEDNAITIKEARQIIKDEMLSDNPKNIPVIEKRSVINFYLDFEKNMVLAKSSHNDQEAIGAFFLLLKRLSESAHEKGCSKVLNLSDESLKTHFFITPYTNTAMQKGEAFGAYNLSNLVEFYAAQELNVEADDCGVTPTWSANFFYSHDNAKVINFRNSIGLFVPDVDPNDLPPSTFSMINKFAIEKELNIKKINVVGEIPLGTLLTKYRDETEEECIEDEIKGTHLDISFSTQSKDGNICFQITDPLTYHKEAIKKMLNNHFKDNSCSNKVIEKTITQWLGESLGVLHDSIDMFATIYKDSNQASEEFMDDAQVELAMKIENVSSEDDQG